MYQMTITYIPFGRNIDKMAIKMPTSFICKAYRNLPKLELLVSKYAIWQHRFSMLKKNLRQNIPTRLNELLGKFLDWPLRGHIKKVCVSKRRKKLPWRRKGEKNSYKITFLPT
jgi:hypothetical protein